MPMKWFFSHLSLANSQNHTHTQRMRKFLCIYVRLSLRIRAFHNAFPMLLFGFFFLFNQQNGHYERARVCNCLEKKTKHDMKCFHCSASFSSSFQCQLKYIFAALCVWIEIVHQIADLECLWNVRGRFLLSVKREWPKMGLKNLLFWMTYEFK